MDGTFRCAPKFFHQLYIIHALVDGFCVPLVYACMEKRDKASYMRLFNVISRRVRVSLLLLCLILYSQKIHLEQLSA